MSTANSRMTAKGAPSGSEAGGRSFAHNGLSPHVAAVEAAREKLGRDLDTLTTEVRAQMGQTAQRTAWKIAATGAGIVAGVLARKGIIAAWKAAKHTDPPTNPAARETQWTEAILWTMATGIGVGVARLVATRGVAAGWERATGKLPPGLQEVSP